MTKQEVNDLIGLYKTLCTELQSLKDSLSDKVCKLDGLNKDLAIAQAQAMQTVLSTITIRIGLNINEVQKDIEEPQSNEAHEQKEDSTKKGCKSE